MNSGPTIRVALVAAVCALLGACTSDGSPALSVADLTYSTQPYGTTPNTPADDPRLFRKPETAGQNGGKGKDSRKTLAVLIGGPNDQLYFRPGVIYGRIGVDSNREMFDG